MDGKYEKFIAKMDNIKVAIKAISAALLSLGLAEVGGAVNLLWENWDLIFIGVGGAGYNVVTAVIDYIKAQKTSQEGDIKGLGG